MVADLSEHEVSKEATLASCCILTLVLLLTSGFNSVLALRVWLIGLLILLGLTSLEFISVNLDWALNPWVEDAEMSWSSFLTTKHYFTWLYIQDVRLWLRVWVFWVLPISVSVPTMFFDFTVGIYLLLLSIVANFIIVGIEELKKKKPEHYGFVSTD